MALEVGKVYNFSTIAGSVLGDNFTNMEVLVRAKATSMINSGVDIYTRHASIVAIVPTLPDNANDMIFVELQSTVTGDKHVLAIPYILPGSIVEVVSTNLRVEVFNTNADAIGVIRLLLAERGFTDVKISAF